MIQFSNFFSANLLTYLKVGWCILCILLILMGNALDSVSGLTGQSSPSASMLSSVMFSKICNRLTLSCLKLYLPKLFNNVGAICQSSQLSGGAGALLFKSFRAACCSEQLSEELLWLGCWMRAYLVTVAFADLCRVVFSDLASSLIIVGVF